MKHDCRHALALALERIADVPEPQTRWVFFNARVLPGLDPVWRGALVCEQGFRPQFLELQAGGYAVKASLGELNHAVSGVALMLGRSRKWNEFQIVRAWNLLPAGGRLLVAGGKTEGVGALRKWWNGQAGVTDSFSKFHSVVFSTVKQTHEKLVPPEVYQPADGFAVSHGMFSSGKIDAGSALLAEHFDHRIRGRVADLGAGWGYLSACLLEKSPEVSWLELFEADFASLEAAKSNLGNSGVKLGFNWLDVSTETKREPRDWVVMNPPFHEGRAAEPDIGKRFIKVAASTLVGGGRLLMVANRNLPYEKTLESEFRRFEKLEERGGYKVIEAVK